MSAPLARGVMRALAAPGAPGSGSVSSTTIRHANCFAIIRIGGAS